MSDVTKILSRIEQGDKDAADELATLGLEVLDDIYLDVLGDRLARQQEVTAEQRQLAAFQHFQAKVASNPGCLYAGTSWTAPVR